MIINYLDKTIEKDGSDSELNEFVQELIITECKKGNKVELITRNERYEFVEYWELNNDGVTFVNTYYDDGHINSEARIKRTTDFYNIQQINITKRGQV